MSTVQLAVAPHRGGWAVKHNGGFVGHVRSRGEAIAIARALAEWVCEDGRAAEIRIEEPRTADLCREPAQMRGALVSPRPARTEGDQRHAQS